MGGFDYGVSGQLSLTILVYHHKEKLKQSTSSLQELQGSRQSLLWQLKQEIVSDRALQ